MRLADNGPLYAETVLGRFPVEPWNTASNAIFLFLIIYFAFRTKLDPRRYPFIVSCLPVLGVGMVGGTLYHATRSDPLWLVLDYLPIMILTGAASVFFWRILLGSFAKALALGVLPILCMRLLFKFAAIPIIVRITLGYTLLATAVILPSILVCIQGNSRGARLLTVAVVSFIIAIFFRFADLGFGAPLLPMGTHFLWHLFGGISTWGLMEFVMLQEALRLRNLDLEHVP